MTATGAAAAAALVALLAGGALGSAPAPAAAGAGDGVCGTPLSPINVDPNLVTTTGTGSFLPKVSWQPAAGLQLTNRGDSVGVESTVGLESENLGYVTLMGRSGFPQYYQVTSLALRTPSEHLLAGRQFPAELQVVHKNQKSVLEVDDQDVLVTSFFFEVGQESKLLRQLLPSPVPAFGTSTTLQRGLDLMWALGPALDGHFYKYNGSYTSPSKACGERVQWAVFESAMTMSEAQLQALQAALTAPRASGALADRPVARDTMEEGRLASYRFFTGRDTGVNPERPRIILIISPIIGTVMLCTAVMCAVFVREDAHRKEQGAGGLQTAKPAKAYSQMGAV